MRVGRKLGLILITLAFLVTGLAFFAVHQAHHDLELSVHDRSRERAQAAVNQLATSINQNVRELQTISRLPDLQYAFSTIRPGDSVGDLNDVTEIYASRFKSFHPEGLTYVRFFNPDGKCLGSSIEEMAAPLTAANRDWASKKDVCFGSPYVGKGAIVIDALLKVADSSGATIGFLSAQIDLADEIRIVESQLEKQLHESHTDLTLANIDGIPICRLDSNISPQVGRPTDAERQSCLNEPISVTRSDKGTGRKFISGMANSAATPLGPCFLLVFDEPYEAALAASFSLCRSMAITSFILLSLAFIIGGSIAGSHSARTDQLVQYVGQVQKYGNATELPAELRDDCVAQRLHALSQDFDGNAWERQAKLEGIEARIELFDQQLAQKDDEVSEWREQVEQAGRSRNYLLSTISYEIRSPLNAVLGYTELLNESVDSSDQRSHWYLEEMTSSGTQLLSTIDGIIDLTVINYDRVASSVVDQDLLPMFFDVVSRFYERGRQKGLDFSTSFNTPLPEKVTLDAARLREILVNLTGNAVRCTTKGSVRIDVDYSAETERLKMVVTDTGSGISEEKMNTLFALPEKETTAGLGVSQRLARTLGGTITCTSEVGQGSRFELEIDAPVANDSRTLQEPQDSWQRLLSLSAPEAPAAPTTDRQLRFNVLLAEDSPDNQRIMGVLLKRMGADVTMVENGQEAVDAILEQNDDRRFDVILLDMQMPVLDGYSAAWQLRSLGRTEPIIAVTAHAMAGEREKCIVAGCSDYISKPLNHKEFAETVRKWALAEISC